MARGLSNPDSHFGQDISEKQKLCYAAPMAVSMTRARREKIRTRLGQGTAAPKLRTNIRP